MKLAVEGCKTCHVGPTQPCVDRNGVPTRTPHKARLKALAAKPTRRSARAR